MRSPRALLCVALAACVFGCGEDVSRPHLFLVSADALRADHTSLHGYPRDTTPNLDALAAEARTFSQAITLVPKTGPSFATHLTGLPPSEHRVTSNKFELPQQAPLLAEILQQHGYETAAFVSNPILSPRKGYDRGFDSYEEFGKTAGLDALNAAFLAWAGARDWKRPTFVWIHYIEPHGPYTPPEPHAGRYLEDEIFRSDERVVPLEYEVPPGRPPNRVLGAVPAYQRLGDEARAAWYVSQYDAEIRYMDAAFGEVLGFLRERGIYDDSGILFTSDHGESLGEHDYFFEHGWFVYDASLRVPLVIKPPGPRAERRHDEQASNLDTLPTLLAMAGVERPSGLPGRDLLAPGEAAPLLVENPSTYERRLLGLRTPEHKYLRQLGGGGEELYDLREDPGERRNLAASDAKLAADLRGELERQQASAGSPDGEPRAVEPSAEERELLERLGYAESEERPVRVVLVTLDTLRRDSFASASDMPHTRALADGARVFRRHYSATSTTQPTHASLFTGLHPWQHGVHRNGVVLEAGLETVVERMKTRGFATGAVVSSFPVHSRFGFGQGFDRFEDGFSEGSRRRWNQVEVPGGGFYSRAGEVTDEALAMLETLSGPKQFFWFHFFDAHQPYGDSPGGASIALVDLKEELRKDAAAAARRVPEARSEYDRDVRYLDGELDRLFERLLADAGSIETHIVVVSDHGESFGEAQSLGHGERLTSEQIRVPLFIRSPRVAAGTSELPVGSVDVAATLDVLAGGDGLAGAGRDLTAPAAAGPREQAVVGMRRTFAKPLEDVRTDGSVAVVEGLKFYAVLGGREYKGDASGVDVNDSRPVDPELDRRLRLLFGSFASELEGRGAAELLDAETQEALEALGYLR